jgi:DNA polymerase I-like protein with 3'-5' exonuclease and polymerase domains
LDLGEFAGCVQEVLYRESEESEREVQTITIVCFDVECSTLNRGNPFTASGKLVSYSVKVDDGEPSFNYFNEIDFLTELRASLSEATLVIGFAMKIDLHWARRMGVRPPERVRAWDCQIAEFLIQGQTGAYPSLNECLAKYGLGQKDDKIAEYWALGIDNDEIPVDELRFYNNLDVELTYKLYLKQQEVMTEKQKKLCVVMGLDLLVLAEMEWNGVKFDKELCRTKADETAKELKIITDELLEYAPSRDVNLDSGHQLSCILYGGAFELTTVDHVTQEIYKSGKKKGQAWEKNHYVTNVYTCDPLFQPLKGTKTKLVSKVGEEQYPVYQTGEDVLKQLRKPTKQHKRIIELLLKRAELAKLSDSFFGKLPGLLETMEWGEYLHGSYNQTVAATGRLSSSSPNMQQFPLEVDQLLISRYN